MYNELIVARALVLASGRDARALRSGWHTLPEYAAFDRALARPTVFERRGTRAG